MVNLKIKESDDEILKKTLLSVLPKINKDVRTSLQSASNKLKRVVEQIFRTSSHYLELNTSRFGLRAELGLTPENIETVFEDMWEIISEETFVTFRPFNFIGTQISGRIQFLSIKSDFSRLLDLDSGFIDYNEEQLHWLEWLLINGDSFYIPGYSFNAEQGGRSGGGIMISGGAWRVPPEWAGNMTDNWLTQMFQQDNNKKILQKAIDEIFSQMIR